MPRQRQPQPTIEECRQAYWAACATYEMYRTDPYSTWRQISEAADSVATARAVWMRRVEMTQKQDMTRSEVKLDAAKQISYETGEDVEWLVNRAKRPFPAKGE